MRNLKFLAIIFVFLAFPLTGLSQFQFKKVQTSKDLQTWWEVQSIDTMKFSRDLAREKASNNDFDGVIDKQLSLIASTGATHVAIGTPYDEEFYPFLERWVKGARKYNLKVWFRGNFAGWEGWFGYSKIGRVEHLELTKKFITSNSSLFEDGDIFTACTECENGGPGDPRETGDLEGHKEFLLEEYQLVTDSFRKIGKNIRTNFLSMNFDLALLMMDKETTKALGGIVVIDHYVDTPEKLISDVKTLLERSGGKVVLGEFGVPIPNIHGNLDMIDQAIWIEKALSSLSQEPQVIGVNYWVGFGGTTQLWSSNYTERLSLDVIRKYFNSKFLFGEVINELGKPVVGAKVSTGVKSVFTDINGEFSLPFISEKVLKVESPEFVSVEKEIEEGRKMVIVLKKKDEDFFFRLQKQILKLIKFKDWLFANY